MTGFRPRSSQKAVLEYKGGRLGISAVPGSGKTRTLAELAARLVGRIEDDQEVLIVTLVNSAVDNFRARIDEAIRLQNLLVGIGYRVRTLHGLAHDIVRERPGVVGLSEDFGIIDEREAEAAREDAVAAWLRSNSDAAEPFLPPEVDGKQADWVRASRWPRLVSSIASAFIKRAKDLQLAPEVLLPGLQKAHDAGDPDRLALARMGVEIYADYQRSLAYRGAVDFDDLIRLALEALQRAPDYLARLQARWPYVLEDEAQDSSELQEKILRLLTGERGNWVRVGDPNQAIYDTFTNADPRFLRSFLEEPGVARITLAESGRSQPAIIELANYLVAWAGMQKAPISGAFIQQSIQPTPPGDPQQNPDEKPENVVLVDAAYAPAQELDAIVESIDKWRPGNEALSVAVLVPRNQRGFEVADLLKRRGIETVELLRSTNDTRQTAGALGNLLQCLADPLAPSKLATAFRVWRRDARGDSIEKALVDTVARRIRRCTAVETYLWPRTDRDWLADSASLVPAAELTLLTSFRAVACRWHEAATLPIDQLVLILAGDLLTESQQLALAHKLAILLRDVSETHPAYRLADLVRELAVIAKNQRRFLGFAREESGFEAPAGKVTVATMHKAKGLEWDRVYLASVNNYNFPSGQAHDTYISEPWYIRDALNLEAEALGQLAVLAHRLQSQRCAGPDSSSGVDGLEAGRRLAAYEEGRPTQKARDAYIAERLRLLYVGITRARRDLIIGWNKGRSQAVKLQPAVSLIALQAYWRLEGGTDDHEV